MANYVTITSDKRKWTAYWLCLFLGLFGVHRFYVGKRFTGVIYLCTLGLLFVGWLHDLGAIRRGKFRDNVGAPLRE